MITQFINSAATTNGQNIRKKGGAVWTLNAFNAGGAAAFVKLYDKNTTPVVGTDVPKIVLNVPAGATAYLNLTTGMQFATGLALAITGAAADSDTTAVAANQVKIALVHGG